MKKLGIIGGLGPMATAYLLQRIIEFTDAQTDQENIDMLIFNCPSVPDRTGYILDRTKENPLPKICEMAGKLEKEGMDYIAIPCITAHYFHKEISESVGIPVINGIRETAEYLKAHDICKAGIMATDGTVQTGLFTAVMGELGIDCVYPSEEAQKEVMEIIYGEVKAGKPADIDKFNSVKQELKKNGAQVIILGCTELSIVKRDQNVGSGVLDTIDVLAYACVKRCAKLRPRYENLITAREE